MNTYKIDLFRRPSIFVDVTDEDEKQFELNGWKSKKHMSSSIVVADEIHKFFENKNDNNANIILFKWLAKHNSITLFNSKLQDKFIELFTTQI